MAYCTVAELAEALRTTITAGQTATAQACIDAAAKEIDDSVDRIDPMPPADPLANRVNVLRAVEWWKSADAAMGVAGSELAGTLTPPRSSFTVQYAGMLMPLKQRWGVA